MLRLQRVIMILSVPFKGRKRKGDCEESALPILYLFVFLSRSVSLLLPLFLLPPHLPTSFVRKCLLNKLTVLWRVISKAQRHSMLMLNLFCIHLRWRGLSTLPSWSYSLPSSSRLRAHTWSLLFVVGNIYSSFFFSLYASIPALFLFIKVAIIFQATLVRMLGSAGVQKHSRVSSCANGVHKSPSQGLSAFHYSPYTFTGLSARPIYLIIPLENCSILLFCCPSACVFMACVYVCTCVLAVGLSTCVALNLWPQILRRLTTAKYSEREWGSTEE